MQINQILNLKFIGANQRISLLDVSFPEKAANLPLIIFAHGFKGFKDWGHFPLLAQKLAEAGFAVIKFNFSHNGGTLAHPIDFPDLEAFSKNNYLFELADLDAIINWACKDQAKPMGVWDNEKIYLIGHSRGGSMVTLKAAQDSRVKKVVSWAAVSDLMSRLPAKVELDHWEQEGVRFIKNGRTKQDMPMKFQFVEQLKAHSKLLNVERACRQLNIPHLIVHGEKDEAVKLSMAKDLKQWHADAKLCTIPNTGHTFGGKHPWEEKELPKASQTLLQETIRFLKD